MRPLIDLCNMHVIRTITPRALRMIVVVITAQVVLVAVAVVAIVITAQIVAVAVAVAVAVIIKNGSDTENSDDLE
jgi:hypothetical protein